MFNFNVEQVKSVGRNTKSFLVSARFWTASVVFRMGEEIYLLEMQNGEIADFRRVDSPPKADITLTGSSEAWSKMLQTVPPQGYHDPMFGAAGSGFEFQADYIADLAPFYPAIQEFIAVLRALHSGRRHEELMPRVDRDFDDAVGRYMYIDVQGVQYRIYYEEAGHGEIPMLLQHTAGADSREWRHMLEDPDYQKMYRMISYDLPFHGKSLPPGTTKWWEERYRLKKTVLMDIVVAISKKLNLDRPVYFGCSIGGMLAPDLAYYHPDEFRAVIGLNAGLGSEYPESMKQFWQIWSHPRVGNQWVTGLIRMTMSPASPEAHVRETMWVYATAAPGVNEGDIHYYAFDHDLTAEQAAQIDTSKTSVYLLTGEYDSLSGDNGTRLLADAIPGCHFEIVPGVGHMGPAEAPQASKASLLAVLQKIASGHKQGAR